MHYYYRANARIHSPGRDVIIVSLGTGWRRTHILPSGTHLDVAARLNVDNRGIRIPAGEFRIFELHISPQNDEELSVGSEWFVDYSGGAIGKCEIVEILGKWRNWRESLPTEEDPQYGFFII